MPFAVYLDLDAAGARDFDKLTRIIEDLDPAISTPRRLGHTHHITLGVYDDIDPGRLEQPLSEIGSIPLDVTFPAIGGFPGERHVLFAAPKVSRYLLDFHERYHQFTAPCGDCQEYYRPGAWFPHMTLAVNLSRSDFDAALNVVLNEWTPITCRLDMIRLVHLDPVETILLRPLGQS